MIFGQPYGGVMKGGKSIDLSYILTAPAAIPLYIYFCRLMNIIRIGIIPIRMAADTISKGVDIEP